MKKLSTLAGITKMTTFSNSLLILCLFSAIFSCGIALESLSTNVSSSCTPLQTQCALGCCPYAQGVCCADGFECCQNGQTCIPVIGICIGLKEDDNGKPSLESSKSTPLQNIVTACPYGMTQCGWDKCCRFANATCCRDGAHCCPHGFRCDLLHSKCIKDSLNDLGTQWGSRYEMGEASMSKISQKPRYKSCPGSNRICPSYTSCCINDNGEWSCCPNPSLPQLSYGLGNCCDTIFGHMCCPSDFPICTPVGCMK